jgi:hypothetical protein
MSLSYGQSKEPLGSSLSFLLCDPEAWNGMHLHGQQFTGLRPAGVCLFWATVWIVPGD